MTAVAVVTPPAVAGIRYRAVEAWGRGANRVIDACKRHGAAPPIFTEQQGFVVVTFKAEMVPGSIARPGSRPEPGYQVGTKSALSRHQVLILGSCQEAKSLLDLMRVIGRTDRSKFRNGIVKPLIEMGLLALTISDKPNSRLQQYRLTTAGEKELKDIK